MKFDVAFPHLGPHASCIRAMAAVSKNYALRSRANGAASGWMNHGL